MSQARDELKMQEMKMAELCEETGFNRSTIHYYMNIGLLHRPRQAGLNLHLFDESHLKRLEQIRHLNNEFVNRRLKIAKGYPSSGSAHTICLLFINIVLPIFSLYEASTITRKGLSLLVKMSDTLSLSPTFIFPYMVDLSVVLIVMLLYFAG